jgi:hypothetical protein
MLALAVDLDRLGPVLRPQKVASLCPRLLDLQNRITCVSCGYHQTLAITCNGRLFVWGRNASGQLGLDDKCVTPAHCLQQVPGCLLPLCTAGLCVTVRMLPGRSSYTCPTVLHIRYVDSVAARY